jgi:hypothetical protein
MSAKSERLREVLGSYANIAKSKSNTRINKNANSVIFFFFIYFLCIFDSQAISMKKRNIVGGGEVEN